MEDFLLFSSLDNVCGSEVEMTVFSVFCPFGAMLTVWLIPRSRVSFPGPWISLQRSRVTGVEERAQGTRKMIYHLKSSSGCAELCCRS